MSDDVRDRGIPPSETAARQITAAGRTSLDPSTSKKATKIYPSYYQHKNIICCHVYMDFLGSQG